nr:MAG TPA: hypothetical protein [Caudoviricetes sp.]
MLFLLNLQYFLLYPAPYFCTFIILFFIPFLL